jgi:hypothetical protein
LKKSPSAGAAQKLFISPTVEWPQFGRSTAAENKSFLVTFFQKSNCLLFSPYVQESKKA